MAAAPGFASWGLRDANSDIMDADRADTYPQAADPVKSRNWDYTLEAAL
jgi:hypothetical protein